MHLVLDEPLPLLDEESKRLQAKKERGYILTKWEEEFDRRVSELNNEKSVRAAAAADPSAEYARIRAKIAGGAVLNKAEMKYLRKTLDQIRNRVSDSSLARKIAKDKKLAKAQKKMREQGAAKRLKLDGDNDNDGNEHATGPDNDDDDDEMDSESGDSDHEAVLTDEQLAEFHQLQEIHDWFGRKEAEEEHETVANHPRVADVIMHNTAKEVAVSSPEIASEAEELLAAEVEPVPVVGPAHPHLPPNSRFRFAEGAPGIENYVEDYLQQIQEEYNPIDRLIREGRLVHSEVMALDIENRPEAVEDDPQQEAAGPYQTAQNILEAPDHADFQHNFIHEELGILLSAPHPSYISEAAGAASVVHNQPNSLHQGQNLQREPVQYNQALGNNQDVLAITQEHARAPSVAPSERLVLINQMELHNQAVPQPSAAASTIHFWLLTRSEEYPLMLSLRSQLREMGLYKELLRRTLYSIAFENQSTAEALITAFPDIITPEFADKPLTVLDFGLAPGGFAGTILSFNEDPATRYYGITLPCSPGIGGLRVIVTDPSNFTVTDELGDIHTIGENRIFWLEQDVTMFALEFGVAENAGCLTNHPSAAEFIMDRPFLDLAGKVDLVIADCVVMNAHFRAEWREDKRKETIRVNAAQLILGLQRLRPGGTIIMKLYKIQDFENILLLQKLDAIGQLSVWKSTEHPATGADFFVVLRGVRVGAAEVQQVLVSLKAIWWKATFGAGGFDGLVGESGAEPERADVERVLRVWGDRFLELGGDVWGALCGALARAADVANPLDESDEDEEHMVDL